MKGTKSQVKKAQKALSRGKGKQAKVWEDYRNYKERIQKSRRIGSMQKKAMIQKKLEKARGNISYTWHQYREFKFSYYNISKFKGLKYIGKKKTKPTLQEYYQVRNIDNLDSIVKNIFDNYKVRYVLIILQIEFSQNIDWEDRQKKQRSAKKGDIQHVSDVFTKISFEQTMERGETLEKAILEKMSFLKHYTGYILHNTYIRVIYASSKTN